MLRRDGPIFMSLMRCRSLCCPLNIEDLRLLIEGVPSFRHRGGLVAFVSKSAFSGRGVLFELAFFSFSFSIVLATISGWDTCMSPLEC